MKRIRFTALALCILAMCAGPQMVQGRTRHCRPLPPPRRPVVYRPVHRPVHVVYCPPPEISIARAVVGTALTAVAVSAAINETRHNTVVVSENVPGTLYDKLPSGYEEVIIGGTTYYKVGDTLYKTTIYNGNPYFEVAAVL